MLDHTQKSNRYENVMQPVVADIANVVNNGIEYRGKKYPVRLASLQADGLERASMSGMGGNFSKMSHYDPISYATTATRVNCKTPEELIAEVQDLRTKDSYDLDVLNRHDRALAEADLRAEGNLTEGRKTLPAKFSFSRGIKNESPFHRVKYFHVTNPGALIFCVAHDLYSGTFREDMAKVLLSLSNQGFFAWCDLQDKFRTYRMELRGDDRQGWYDVIASKPTFHHLPGNHSSNHLVIRFLSSLWIIRKPTDPMFQTTEWSMYLVMKRISELVSAKVVTDRNRQELSQNVYEYLKVQKLLNLICFLKY
jgi:hypothetical protein